MLVLAHVAALAGFPALSSCNDKSGKAPHAVAAAELPSTHDRPTGAQSNNQETVASPLPAIERAEPAPPLAALQLNIELGTDHPYVGEPLAVRIYLASPLAESLQDEPAGHPRSSTAGDSPLAKVAKDWPAGLHIELFDLPAGQPGAAGAALDWSKLRLAGPAAICGNPFGDWEIPISANLTEGDYSLRVTASDKNLVGDGPELSAEVGFHVGLPHDDPQIAEHTERLALLAYRQGRFAQARQLAEQAVKADPDSTTPQRIEMLLAQADGCLAMDDFQAGLDVCRTILNMALDDRLAADLTGKVQMLETLVAKPK